MTDKSQKKVDDTEKGSTPEEPILKYFLFLYEKQLGARQSVSSEIVPVEGQKTPAYDLNVTHNDQLKARRISLSPIGEDTGSKSKCFLVIYDNKLVVKIPPRSNH